jgi:signal peptidase I
MSGSPPDQRGGSARNERRPDGDDQAPTTLVTVAHTRAHPDHRLRGLDFVELGGGHDPALPPQSPSHRRRRRRLLLQWALVLAVALAVAVFLRLSVIEPFSVPSSAMMPTLSAGDRILVLKTGLLVGPITRGDIVVFRGPDYSPCNAGAVGNGDFVKRVIGLPGETIQSVGTTIDIDGRPLSEPGWYQSTAGPIGSTPIRRTTIPPDHYFVLGDSRADSCDSRSFGTVPGSSIVGKVVAVFSHDGHPDFRLI